jgi:hypothetical protein
MFNGIQNNCNMCDHPPGLHKCCSQCGDSANGSEDISIVFGFRALKPEYKGRYLIPQAWCRKCRAQAARDKRLKKEILA